MPKEGLSDQEVVQRVRDVLEERGVPIPPTLRFTLPQYHSQYDMTLAGQTLDAGPRIVGTGTPDAMARIADMAQILIRSSMIIDEMRRLIKRRGGRPPAMPLTPPWGLACHPYALAVLESRGPECAWMRDPAYWSERSGRVFDIQASTLKITNMAACGLRNATWENTAIRFDASQTYVDWFKAAPRASTVEIRSVLPDTIVQQLPGRWIGDLIETPQNLPDRLAEALRGVTIASAETRIGGTTHIDLAPCAWIEAMPLPDDADPACLSVPLPHR